MLVNIVFNYFQFIINGLKVIRIDLLRVAITRYADSNFQLFLR